MRNLLPLLILALVGSSGAAAGGCPPSSCGTASVAVPGSPVLHVRAAGSRGPLVAYDLATGRRSFSLAPGLLSADGRTYVAVRSREGVTTLARFDARTGAARGTSRLQGARQPSALSANGRWLALVRNLRKPSRTRIDVVDTRKGRVAHSLTLAGTIEPEAVANSGNRMFVVQYLRNGYVVRGVDLATGRLTTLRAKGDPSLMGGTAWSSVASPDGRWLFTLYFEPDGGAAVHTLDLVHRIAVCIDIPSGQPAALREYGIALSPDGTHAYAVNPALGAVADIDLGQLRVARVSDFTARPGKAAGSTAVATRAGNVYFSSGIGLWSYANGLTRLVEPGGNRIVGLGVTPDSRRLLVVRAGGSREFLSA